MAMRQATNHSVRDRGLKITPNSSKRLGSVDRASDCRLKGPGFDSEGELVGGPSCDTTLE